MSLTVQLTDAAHAYGLDNLSFTPSGSPGVLGTPVSQVDSWGTGPLPVGVPGQVVEQTSTGFTITMDATVTGPSTGVLSVFDVSRGGVPLVVASGTVPFTGATWASDFSPAQMFSGDDTITGNSFNNVLQGGLGNDRIDGGGGTDTAVFQGLERQYTITRSGSAMIVSGPDGTDTLVNIERLKFDDFTVAYDTSGTAGQAYRLYQAAFNRAPDAGGLGYWTNDLDHGVALNDVAQAFVTSPEFAARYGTLDDNQFVNQLYENVLHRAGEQTGVEYWTTHLTAHDLTRPQVLAYFSESPENQAALIGTTQNGMVYTG